MNDRDHEDILARIISKRLDDGVRRLYAGRDFASVPESALTELIARETAYAWQKLGVRLGRLVPIVARKARYVHIASADLDEKGINTIVLNIVAERPDIDMEDLAAAFSRAFPRLRNRVDTSKARKMAEKVA